MSVVKARQFNESRDKKEVFNLKDVAIEAREMIRAAQEESERIVREAKETMARETKELKERTQKEAYEKGYQDGMTRGLEDGAKKGYEDASAQTLKESREAFAQAGEKTLTALKQTLTEFDQIKQQLIWQAEQAMVVLALNIAEKVIGKTIAHDPEVAVRNLKQAMELVSRTSDVVIHLNPTDIAHLRHMKELGDDILGAFERIRLQIDETVEQGGCLIRTLDGEIDAGIETQITRIADELIMTPDKLKDEE